MVLPACPPGGGGAPGGRYITMMDTIPPVRGSGAVVVDITCPPASLRSSLVVAPAPSRPSRLSANKSRGVRKLIRFHCNLVKNIFTRMVLFILEACPSWKQLSLPGGGRQLRALELSQSPPRLSPVLGIVKQIALV